MNKDLRGIVRRLEAQGLETRRTTKGHVLVLQQGRVLTSFAGTPSDWRSWRNSVAPLKRAGIAV